jgi:hypothetical protein
MGPLVYLTLCSMRNRFRVRITRLRQPRYLIGLIAGLAYFYFFFWRPRGTPTGRATGMLAAMSRMRPNIEFFGAAALFVIAALAWVWPSRSRPTLAFSKADVQFLFPAPFTRRQLIRYRVLRSQLGAFIGSAFMTLLFRPTGTANAWMFFLGIALLMAIVNLHLTGVSLSRESLGTHGMAGLARQWLPLVMVAGALVVLGGTVAIHWAELSAIDNGPDVIEAALRLTSTGAAAVVLWPFHALVRLPMSATPADFAAALPAVLIILLLNYAWVLRSDAAFEEASAELAEKVARVRKGPQPTGSGAKSLATPFRLSLEGRPEMAIFWKNLILIGRYLSWRTLLRVMPALVVFGVLVTQGSSRGVSEALGRFSAIVCVMSVIMGPQIARNDLRHDLANLAVLRTWPMRGAAIVRGEVLGPAAILTGLSWLFALGFLMLSTRMQHRMPPTYVLGFMIVVPGIVIVQLLVQNAIAVMWPSWAAIGSRHSRGIDVMGQRLIMMFGLLVVFLIAVLPAGIAAALVGFGLYWATSSVHILLPAIVAAAVLLGEAFLASEVIGKILDRTDVGQIDATES